MRDRLRNQSLHVEWRHPIPVIDEDRTPLGDFAADLYVEGRQIVERKACRALDDGSVAQLPGSLRGGRVEHGLPINFGVPTLQIRKYILWTQCEIIPRAAAG